MMNNLGARVGWSFWLLWVLASTVGLAVGVAVIFTLIEALGEAVAEAPPIAVTGAVIGTSMRTVSSRLLLFVTFLPFRRKNK